MFLIEDTSIDARFKDNPLITGETNIRFYAGAPLHEPLGFKVGTLCIIDSCPRTLNASQLHTLKNLGQLVKTEVEQRYCISRRGATLHFPSLIAQLSGLKHIAL